MFAPPGLLLSLSVPTPEDPQASPAPPAWPGTPKNAQCPPSGPLHPVSGAPGDAPMPARPPPPQCHHRQHSLSICPCLTVHVLAGGGAGVGDTPPPPQITVMPPPAPCPAAGQGVWDGFLRDQRLQQPQHQGGAGDTRHGTWGGGRGGQGGGSPRLTPPHTPLPQSFTRLTELVLQAHRKELEGLRGPPRAPALAHLEEDEQQPLGSEDSPKGCWC